MTVSLSEDLATYLRSTPNVSSTVAEAVVEYRTRELERELEAAYAEDADEAAELDREWTAIDSEIAD